jgi:DNA polymerase I-like protein with 3'-5' exonuclease and polymerase domains
MGTGGLPTICYIQHPEFHEEGVAVLIVKGDAPYAPRQSVFWPGVTEELNWLRHEYGENLERCTVVMHNAKFDASILARKHGIYPPFILDTIALSRHQDARNKHNLKDVAVRWGLPAKGETEDFRGLHWDTMTQAQRESYASYANRDAEITFGLVEILLPRLTRPEVEVPLQRHTLKMYVEPEFDFDQAEATRLAEAMEAQVAKDCDPLGLTPKEISGNKTFAKLLGDALAETGEVLAMKQGKNGLIAALAKDDDAVQQYKRHRTPRVRELVKARQAVKSWPLHSRRVRAMSEQARAAGGRLPNAVNYYGASTGRFSGGEGINLQNLPTRGGGLQCEIKHLLRAPAGCLIVHADAAQIEARGLAWLAGQTDLVQAFAQNRDIYSDFAAEVLGAPCRKPRKDDPPAVAKVLSTRRSLGKVGILGCFEAGTLVLTRRGWVPIEQVNSRDRVWDGERWVTTIGPIFRGVKTTIRWQGIGVTPDHRILTREGWVSVSQVLRGGTRSLQSAQFMGTLESLGTRSVLAAELKRLKLCARSAVAQSMGWMSTISSAGKALAATSVLSNRVPAGERSGVGTPRSSPMGSYAAGCLTESRRSTRDVEILGIRTGPTTGVGVFVLPLSGWEIEPQCCGISSPFRDTLTRLWRSTVSTITKDMSRGTSAFAPSRETWKTAERSSNSSRRMPTYDLGLCGSNSRFTILTTAGPMIVHNCGYGMGGPRCYEYMETYPELAPKIESGEIDLAFSKRLVDAYRNKYRMIPTLWRDSENAFAYTTKYGVSRTLRGLEFSRQGTTTVLRLPSGRCLFYPHARIGAEDRLAWQWGDLWGGSIVENIIQSVSRDVLVEAVLAVEAAGFRVALHCHDSIVVSVEKSRAEEAKACVCAALVSPPIWALNWPLGVEASISERYE